MAEQTQVRIQFKADGAEELAGSVRAIRKELKRLRKSARKAAKTLAKLRRLQLLVATAKEKPAR